MAAKIFQSSLEDQMRNWFIKRMKRMHSKAKNSLLPMMKYGNGMLKKSDVPVFENSQCEGFYEL